MRVLLSTIGSRGDVQPLAALALELTTLGQDVRLCVAPDFQAWIAGLGLAVTPIGPELRPMMAARPATPPAPMTPEQRRALAEASVATQFQTVAAAAEGCDVIVAATALQIAARSVAEVRGIPYVFAAYCPNVLPSLPRSRADRRRARPCVHRAPVAGRGSGAGAVTRPGGRRRVPARRLAAGRRAAVARRARGVPRRRDAAHLFRVRQHARRAGSRARDARGGAGARPPRHRAAGLGRSRRRRAGRLPGHRRNEPAGAFSARRRRRPPRRRGHHDGRRAGRGRAVVVPQIYDQHYFAQRVRDLGIGVAHPPGPPSTASLSTALEAALRPEVGARARLTGPAVRRDGARIAAERLLDQR